MKPLYIMTWAITTATLVTKVAFVGKWRWKLGIPPARGHTCGVWDKQKPVTCCWTEVSLMRIEKPSVTRFHECHRAVARPVLELVKCPHFWPPCIAENPNPGLPCPQASREVWPTRCPGRRLKGRRTGKPGSLFPSCSASYGLCLSTVAHLWLKGPSPHGPTCYTDRLLGSNTTISSFQPSQPKGSSSFLLL